MTQAKSDDAIIIKSNTYCYKVIKNDFVSTNVKSVFMIDVKSTNSNQLTSASK